MAYVVVTICFNHMVRVISYILSIQIRVFIIGLSRAWNSSTIVLIQLALQEYKQYNKLHVFNFKTYD